MAEETFHRSTLSLSEVREPVPHVLQVRNIGEQAAGIDEVLVYIVEVGEKHVAPEDEIIQRLRGGEDLAVAIVQIQEERHTADGRSPGGMVEEIVDREHSGGFERP